MNATRISTTGVVASTGGSIITAAVVLLTSSLALANPPELKPEAPYKKPAPQIDLPTGLDLPMGPAPFGPGIALRNDDEQGTDQGEQEQGGEAGDDPRDVPPPVFFGEEIDTESPSLVFVVDLSGSMTIMSAGPFEDENGVIRNGNRLDRAKAELKKSIQGLPENFSFNILAYDECVDQLWGEKQEASAPNKIAAFAWIDALQPDGWTNTGLAIQSALLDKDNTTVVLLSDGAPNFLDCAMNYVGSFDDHANLVKMANTQGAKIDTFGIGVSSDPAARSFMQRIAAENGGTYIEVE